MKKFTPVILLLAFMLAGCSLLNGSNGNGQTLNDDEMATRVAQLLQTMTTPTTEIDFPPTETPTAIQSPTLEPSATAQVEVATSTPAEAEATATPDTILWTDTPTPEATNTPEATTTPVVLATATTSVTATLQPSDPAYYLGTPTGQDNMESASQWSWPTGSDDYLNVGFNNGMMQMTGLTNLAGWRLPLVAQQVNTYIETTVNTGSCSEKDSYGIIFRVPVFKDPTQGYLFQVTCDGYYRLWKWDGKVAPTGQATVLVPWKQSSDIVTGANQVNRLGVKTIDNTLTIYINGVQQAAVSDGEFTAGFFGVFVRSAGTSNYTVNYDTIKYWENPK